jgi:hypothetical protein
VDSAAPKTGTVGLHLVCKPLPHRSPQQSSTSESSQYIAELVGSLAVEAVIGELVSVSHFPDPGENTGYLPSSGRLNDNNPTPSQWEYNDLAAEFPMQQNREDVRRNSEQKAA